MQKHKKEGRISGRLRVMVRVKVNFRDNSCAYGYKEVSHNYCVLGIIESGPSEAVIQENVFLRCDSHSKINLFGILRVVKAKLCMIKH